jgi:1,4-dihydroxy-2-naphthoate octaprenyltransferase
MNKMLKNLPLYFLAARPKFFTASILPVFVGSALGYLTAGTFNMQLFILATLAIIFIHAGANLANDYYDHKSRNDLSNKNLTPFSGGSRFIQNNLLSPQVIITESLISLAIGALLGLWIVYITKSQFILTLGIIGTCGAFFYTATPFKLGYRGLGEFIIALLFGLFSVYAAYYLQTQVLDLKALMPALIVSILIFEVILINEFPDLQADAEVNKKTLPVLFEIPLAATTYRIALITAYLIAAVMLFTHKFLVPALFFLLTSPVAFTIYKSSNAKDLAQPAYYRPNQFTILLHILGSLSLTLGFLIQSILDKF